MCNYDTCIMYICKFFLLKCNREREGGRERQREGGINILFVVFLNNWLLLVTSCVCCLSLY